MTHESWGQRRQRDRQVEVKQGTEAGNLITTRVLPSSELTCSTSIAPSSAMANSTSGSHLISAMNASADAPSLHKMLSFDWHSCTSAKIPPARKDLAL